MSVPNNLPFQSTTFVGRAREKSDVAERLASARLLTLMGAGGAGKTRLALEVASEVSQRFPDGVWLIELAPLADPALVPRAAASVFGVTEQGDKPAAAALAATLRDRRVLLILDNCEHVVAAVAELVEMLLRSCPNVRLLATSREAIGITGETAWRVPSLSIPDPRVAPQVEPLRQYEAVQLFDARAQASRPGFEITADNAAAVAQVCRRLDGIPLAIELAAARLSVLTIEQLAAKLGDRFRLLTGGSRTALPRQQTLRATMDWSYDLLAERERMLLRRLSVFAGGWTLEAAEAICAGAGVAESDVLDLLGRLVDKSLVVAEAHRAEARYRLLETVRQYARDRLVEAGEAASARARHRDWYTALAERLDPDLRGPRQRATLAQYELEHDNFRSALEWSLGEDDGVVAALRLTGMLYWFWYLNGHWREGRTRADAALARVDVDHAAMTPAFLWTFYAAAHFAWRQGDLERAASLCETGLARIGEGGPPPFRSRFLLGLGNIAQYRGAAAQAKSFYEQAAAIMRDSQDSWGVAQTLGLVAQAVTAEEYAQSADTLRTALRLNQDIGDPWQRAFLLRHLANAALRHGRIDEGEGAYEESLRLVSGTGDRWLTDNNLNGLASVACARGDYRRATRLLAAAARIREMTGNVSVPGVKARETDSVASARSVLGDAAFDAAWAEGAAMTLEEAVTYALEPAEHRASVKPAAEGPLTAREQEVASLVARGQTNREIAATLVLSNRTVDAHVQNILNKLGFNSRAQIAAWAAERGLTGERRPT